ncbi:MAG TPA: DUF4402 domain-containing protein [Candidatus Kryptonia bacterium]
MVSKRLSVSISLILASFCTCVGQSNSSGAVSISANVIRGIVITNSTNLAFGTLVSGSGTQSVSPTEPGVGSFTFSGQPGSNVSVTFPNNVILTDGSGHSVAFNPAIPIWNNANSQLLGAQPFSGITGGSVGLGAAGQVFVWFGGGINTNGATSGNYSGNYTVDITY